MADVGGIGGFNPATTRSEFDADAAAQRRAEERARQEELQEERRVEQQEEALQSEEATAEREQAEQQRQEDLQDEVALSNAAQEFLTRTAQENANAANDDAVAAAEAAEAGAQATQVGGVDGTNQDTADEENNATVNGSQDDESEQTRALGQIVDQFA
ncbi:MAG: hypothetical protein RIM33_18180 [Alphaproteobacteria bacterium]